MTYYPEPWDPSQDDVEIAEEMSVMEALDPPFEPDGKSHSSVFRRYWERLLRYRNRI